MKTYKLRFLGRNKGAIGTIYKITTEVEANSLDGAVLKLYDQFEHISLVERLD
jgi:hypothetical protein